jgi:outer membrane protein assembly factor BamA
MCPFPLNFEIARTLLHACIPVVICLLVVFEFPLHPAPEDTDESVGSEYGSMPGGTLIRNIYIEIDEVYGPDEKFLLLIRKNALHWKTKERTIRHWLPYTEGDEFRPGRVFRMERTLKETERLNVVTNTRVVQTEDGFVDMYIHVQDIFSMYVDFLPEISGDMYSFGFTIGESNFLGRHAVAGAHAGRDNFFARWQQKYDDPWFFDSRWRFSERVGFQYDTDGNHVGEGFGVTLERPLRSRQERWGWKTSFAYDNDLVYKHTGGTIDNVILPSGEFEKKYQRKNFVLENMLLHSFGDRRKTSVRGRDGSFSTEEGGVGRKNEDSVFNAGLFVHNLQGRYRPYDALAPEDDAVFRRDVMRDDFTRHKIGLLVEANNHIDTELTNFKHYWHAEYLPLGSSINATFAASQKFWGSDENAGYITLELANNALLSGKQIIQSSICFTSDFVAEQGQRNMLTTLSYTHHFRGLPLGQLVFRAEAAFGERLNNESVLTLGADTGLRGYRVDRFEGDRRLLFNLEYRLPPLFRIPLLDEYMSFVAFADLGSCWYNHERSLRQIRLYPGAGIGIRLSSPVGNNTVVRYDFASNFGNDKSSFGSIFTFSFGHAF